MAGCGSSDGNVHNIIALRVPRHFGDCPYCGGNDGYINVGPNHWFVCRTHKVKWKAGKDNFPGWRSENEQTWKINYIFLSHYREVIPWYKWKKTATADRQAEDTPAKVLQLKKAAAN